MKRCTIPAVRSAVQACFPLLLVMFSFAGSQCARASPICLVIVTLHSKFDGMPIRAEQGDPRLELKAVDDFLEILYSRGIFRTKDKLLAELSAFYSEELGIEMAKLGRADRVRKAIAFLETRRASLIRKALPYDPEVKVIDEMLRMVEDYRAHIRSFGSNYSVLGLLLDWSNLAREIQSRYLIRVLSLVGSYPGKYDLNQFSVLNELLIKDDVTDQGLAAVLAELDQQVQVLKLRKAVKAEELIRLSRPIP